MKYIPQAVTQKVAQQAIVLQKHSPTILFGIGVVGVVATTVLASRATLKVETVLDDLDAKLEDIETLYSAGDDARYSSVDYRKDKVYAYSRAVVGLNKLYMPTVIVGVASIAALTGSHRILSNRNAALGLAYTTLDKAFSEYRRRVVDEIGAEKERDIRFAAVTKEVAAESKDGKKTKEVKRGTSVSASPYSFFFSPQHSTQWSDRPDYNFIFLKAQQTYANDRLRAKGYIFLNDVLDSLGIDRTPAGQSCGWLYRGDGDGYVDFGIFDRSNDSRVIDFMEGIEDHLLLDFNCDGNIREKI